MLIPDRNLCLKHCNIILSIKALKQNNKNIIKQV